MVEIRPGRFVSRERTPVPIDQESVWTPRAGLHGFDKRKLLSTMPEFDPERSSRGLVAILLSLSMVFFFTFSCLLKTVKVKQSHYRPGGAQRVSGS